MIKLKLQRGIVALIDEEDYERCKLFKWFTTTHNGIRYVKAWDNSVRPRKNISLHRFIMQENNTKVFIDHINHNGLDNRKQNLRRCTLQQNSWNKRAYKNTTSKYLGVHYSIEHNKRYNKTYCYWRAAIRMNNRPTIIGRFKTEEEAALAYNKEAIRLYGKFANLNVIDK